MENTIYTHDEATKIIEYFEAILEANGIVIPSPEDDDRDSDNGATLYGSTYSDLMDDVENTLIEILDKAKNAKVVSYEYSGTY